MVYEDFYPTSDSEALITVGAHYTTLTEIRKAKYKIENGKVVIIESEPYIKGTHLRLGNIHNGTLFYSDNRIVVSDKIEGDGFTGEQPFMNDIGIFFTCDKGIYLDAKMLIELWNDYREMGNPCVDGKWVYFEARINPAPQGWEIWRYNIETKVKEQVRKRGANPYIFNGKLYYSMWEKNGFVTYVEKV